MHSFGILAFVFSLILPWPPLSADGAQDEPIDPAYETQQLKFQRVVVPNFTPVRAVRPSWNWVAAALTVASTLGTAPSVADHCALVAAASMRLATDCCGQSATQNCSPPFIRSALTRTLRGSLGQSSYVHLPQPLTATEIVAILKTGRPIVAGLGWPEAPHEFLVVYGYRTSGRQTNFLVFDPTVGKTAEIDYPTLLGDTQEHTFWSDSWYSSTTPND